MKSDKQLWLLVQIRSQKWQNKHMNLILKYRPFVQGQRMVSLMVLIWYCKLPHTSRPPHSTPHSFRITVKQWEPGQQTGSRSWMFPFTCCTVPSLTFSKRNSRTSSGYYRQIESLWSRLSLEQLSEVANFFPYRKRGVFSLFCKASTTNTHMHALKHIRKSGF